MLSLLFVVACGDKDTSSDSAAATDDSTASTDDSTASADDSSATDDSAEEEVDLDEDGFNEDEDCNDSDPAVFPGAEEACNEIDDDCDDSVDEGLELTVWYVDADGDEFEDDDEDTNVEACAQPDGYAAASGDCDDEDLAINPHADDVLGDGVDSDCDQLDCAAGTLDGAHFAACPGAYPYLDARLACKTGDHELASIRSADENGYVGGLMNDAAIDFGWIGFDDMDTEGTFVWSDGNTESYTNWADGEPNDENGEDCAVVQQNLEWAWNDAICNLTTLDGFICQRR